MACAGQGSGRPGPAPARVDEATAGGALEEQTKIGRMLQEGGNGLSGAQQPQSLWSAAQQGASRFGAARARSVGPQGAERVPCQRSIHKTQYLVNANRIALYFNTVL